MIVSAVNEDEEKSNISKTPLLDCQYQGKIPTLSYCVIYYYHSIRHCVSMIVKLLSYTSAARRD